jgi:serine/threonine protein kinase
MLIEADKSSKVRYRVVICDFGLVSVIDQQLLGVKAFVLPQIKGASLAYAAPERFFSVDQFTPDAAKACDVYSVAIVFYELLTRSMAWQNMRESEQLKIAVASGKRPVIPQGLQTCAEISTVYRIGLDLMTTGWHQEPARRPTMVDIETTLRSTIE